jgi:drug/metabolite transporter (DMT)-like permease
VSVSASATVTGRRRPPLTGAAAGLGAAALFGASTPAAKRLVGEVHPLVLGALLYAGAALAVTAASSVRRLAGRRSSEAPLRRADAPALLAIIALGGMAGPLLMLFGLSRVSGFAASLLLNLEAPLTMLVALSFFGEQLGRRAGLGAAAIIAGAGLLGLGGGGAGRTDVAGSICLAAACLCWGVENNLSQRVSGRDPLAVVRVKSGGAALGMTAAALALGLPWPGARVAVAALGLGGASYGVSMILDLVALRLLGAAREAAYFATAPFFGAILSIVWLGDRPLPAQGAATVAMLIGVILVRGERHEHRHEHTALAHDHRHVHDAHHQHAHAAADGPVVEPHAHAHRHDPLTHAHPHLSDEHHRHTH